MMWTERSPWLMLTQFVNVVRIMWILQSFPLIAIQYRLQRNYGSMQKFVGVKL